MFDNINEKEYQLLKDALPMITVLIAGADGKIDDKETEWASKVTGIRSFAYKKILQDFYAEVGEEFDKKLGTFVQRSKDNHKETREEIIEQLVKINKILPKLDNLIGHHLYKSYVSFAEHVAKASGGFLRFGTVSHEEKLVISLPMLDPIELEETDEE